jgi:diguanylate cyclase (GGDEF)-like protein
MAENEATTRPDSEKACIMIVDDNPTNMAVMVDYLTHQDFEVMVAEDGESALELLKYNRPELILLDVMMPRMDGFETCLLLKAGAATRDIPVIFMTSLTDTADKVKGFEVGAVDYITKPIQHEELLARVNTHIALRNLQRRLEEKNAQLEAEIAERKELQQTLERLAVTDSLTGTFNRRHFFDLAGQEIARSQRYKRPLSVIMFDIDHFKRVNDRYGHLVGDQILCSIAGRVQGELRINDVLGRYGGEEFAILLPETCQPDAFHVAERLRESVADRPFQIDRGELRITISLGVTCVDDRPELSVERLLDEADKALYRAKRGGRDRSEVYGGGEEDWNAD